MQWFFSKWTKGSREGKTRGFPYVCNPSFCWYKREAKVKPSAQYEKDSIICIGYAKGEEHRNMKGNFRYPLQEYGLTEQDCIKYLEKRNIINPLYKYFDRLGCYLCPMQPKKNIKLIYERWRPLFNIMLMLESMSPQGFNPEYKLSDIAQEMQEQTKLVRT